MNANYAKPNPGRKRRVAGWVLLVIGAIFFVAFPATGYFVGGMADEIRTRQQVDVRVIDMSDGRPTFEIVGGEFAGRKATSFTASQPPAHFVGDEVKGYFDPAASSIETDATMGTMSLLRTIFTTVGLALGGALMLVGLILLLLGRRARAKAVAAGK